MSELSATLLVTNKLGLHARPAGMLVKIAQQFPKAELRLAKNGNEVNGKSIMGVLTLAAAQGESVEVRVWGEGADELLRKLTAFFETGFLESY